MKRLVVGLMFLIASARVLPQAAPSATDSESPFSVGGGLSGFNTAIDGGKMYGGTLWADYRLNKAPWALQGIGFEVEARDLLLGRSSSQPSYLSEKTFSGGVTYTYRHWENFRPYGKVLIGYGTGIGPTESRTVTSLGGGLDYHLFGKVWLRGEYEYQRWPDYYKNSATSGGAPLNPNGFTFGVTYHFGHKKAATPAP